MSSYTGAPEDEPGYWIGKEPDEEEEGFPEPLSSQIHEAFVDRGWIMPTTEDEVKRVEQIDDDIDW